MKINDIKFLPKANAFSDVYGKATGMPFVGEMMVAAAGNGGSDEGGGGDDGDELPYILQSLTASAECDEESGEFTPIVVAAILSPYSMELSDFLMNNAVLYSWYHDDGNGNEQSFPNDPDNDYPVMGYDYEELITDQNYQDLGVSSDYIGWYFCVFSSECATLFYAEHAEDTAEYTISIDNGEGRIPIGSSDIEVDYQNDCSDACNGGDEEE